jgi:hypothetical protein
MQTISLTSCIDNLKKKLNGSASLLKSSTYKVERSAIVACNKDQSRATLH